MSELDPDLKRLLKWARAAVPSELEEAPLGFASRVLAGGKPVAMPGLLHELQRVAWGLSCASLALILCGGLIWVSQRATPPPAGELSAALSFLANHLPQ